ncbi:MAG: tetraacyldisaccharide 4'-kinase [Gammaproteobacteria bacterium]|nr:tetraacyldisaccharide 4'-kinase [Gammaproteobacteria bacterium]
MKRLDAYWWDRNGIAIALLPLSWLFCALVWIRRTAYRIRILPTTRLSIPVIVVGNISVGGAGKTPLVVWLAKHLQKLGYRPGIVSRGYGGNAQYWPQQVLPGSDPIAVGDEPVLIARLTNCPVSVGPDRVIAALAMQKYTECDVIVSDDGLQHYALWRDIEIVVVDGDRGVGNGFCLPAGPLREQVSRLDKVDMVVSNGTAGRGRYVMLLKQTEVINLADPTQVKDLDYFADEAKVHAIAGIGNPERFFKQLEMAGLNVVGHEFPDHHKYQPEDLEAINDAPLLMTEKDAVKCQRFAQPHHWFVRVEAELHDTFEYRLDKLVRGVCDG